mgnify:CR=1 FL=1
MLLTGHRNPQNAIHAGKVSINLIADSEAYFVLLKVHKVLQYDTI